MSMLAAALAVTADDRPAGKEAKPGRSVELSVEAASGAAERNENVAITRVDNNAVKEALIRLGAVATPVDAPSPAQSYFGAEHGKLPAEALFLPKAARYSGGWHGTLSQEHRNSIFNARTFFQVGPVQPSHANAYSVTAGGQAGRLGYVALEASQRKVRGMVNGNVLVPLAEERSPRAADPTVRAVVARMLAAFKPELPNRLDFDPRALNTNSPQCIDDHRLQGAIERSVGLWRVNARYRWNSDRVDAFQLVAGQNPDTTLRSHQARLSAERPLAGGIASLAAGFDRLHSLLAAEPNAFPSRVRFGFQLEELGPQAEFPIDRAENAFRAAAQLVLPRKTHRWIAGANAARLQFAGREALNANGYIQFTSNFGRSAIENFLAGSPSSYEVTLGNLSRGFRNVDLNAFAGDTWKPGPRFQLLYGARLNLRTAPREVNGRVPVPYRCDCNNVSPRFGLAWRPSPGGRDYGTVRAAYTVSYGEIFGVTYQQARLNAPEVRWVQTTNPSLLDPLAGFRDDRRSAVVRMASDLVAPYSHQYTLVWQRQAARVLNVQLGYIGSRTFKLFAPLVTNRAGPVPGIPLTTATVNQRRPDPTHFEIIRVLNSGIAYFDAGQARVSVPLRRGLALSGTYTFSKAIDTGASYISTAAQADMSKGRAQSEFDLMKDRRSLSDFDAPHSFLAQYSCELPVPAGWRGVKRRLLAGWSVAGATLFKKGTPMTLYIGSDSPGYGNVDGSPSDRPHVLDPRVLGRTVGDPDTAQKLLPREAFAYIRPGELAGNIGRNTIRKGGINNWNVSLGRIWKIPAGGRERSLAFRAEAYNLTNHPQFDEPGRNLSAPSFGRITNTLNDGRIFQFALRLNL